MFWKHIRIAGPTTMLVAFAAGCGGGVPQDGGFVTDTSDTMAATATDPCAAANVTGTGYCGYTKADGFSGLADPHVIYNCNKGVSSLAQICAGQCQLAPAGQSDTCITVASGTINGLGKCLDIAGNATADGTKTQIWDCNGGKNQQFRLTAAGELRIAYDALNTCLDVDHSHTADGTKVQEWTCNGTDAQKWVFRDILLRNALGKCVDLPDSSWSQGAAAQLGDCATAQRWTYDPASGALLGQNGMCLDVRGGSTDPGAIVQIWPCNGTAAQTWRPANGGFASTVEVDRCLDVKGGQTANGTAIQTYGCNGTAAQRFALSGAIHAKLDDRMCLDISNADTASGTQIQIYTCNGTNAQNWDVWSRADSDYVPVDRLCSHASAISEFSPAFGRSYNGTCTQASAAMVLTAANGLTTNYQTMVNLMVSMRDVMYGNGSAGSNGAATISAMAAELRNRGADISVQWNYQEPLSQDWLGLLRANAGIHPILLQVARAHNLYDINGVYHDANVDYHAIAVLGVKEGAGYYVGDPDTHSPSINIYPRAALEVAVPCGLIMVKTHSEPASQPPAVSCGAGDINGPNNGWCGADNRVYYCYQGTWILKQDCNSRGLTCKTSPGGADYCG